MGASVLAELLSGKPSKDLLRRVRHWRAAVAEKVASMQFDSVEEFGRQLDFAGEYTLPRVPLTKRQQQMSFSAETGDVLEADDLAASKTQSDIAGECRLQRVTWSCVCSICCDSCVALRPRS